MSTRTTALFLTACLAALAAPLATAAGTSPDGFIYGTVTTRAGTTYTGFLRWGSEEAFWDDLLHSAKDELPYESHAVKAEDDGQADESWWEVFGRTMNVKLGSMTASKVLVARFGDIARIEVTGSDSAKLTLRSGSMVAVSGYANDVGGEIVVNDAAVGVIELPWTRIATIVFAPAPAAADPGASRLYGTVTTDSGDFTGFVQWDSQEALSSDRLDGDADDGRMAIEMGRIARIERRTKKSSLVVLSDGRELVLKGTNDVDDDIRGILVEDPRFGRVKVPWSTFQRAVFSPRADSGPGFAAFPARTALRGTVTDRKGAKHVGEVVVDMDESEGWEMLNGSAFDVEYNLPFHIIATIAPSGSTAAVVTLKGGGELRLEDSQDVTARNDGILVKPAGGSAPIVVAWSDVASIALE